jgi:hypothetical protein
LSETIRNENRKFWVLEFGVVRVSHFSALLLAGHNVRREMKLGFGTVGNEFFSVWFLEIVRKETNFGLFII